MTWVLIMNKLMCYILTVTVRHCSGFQGQFPTLLIINMFGLLRSAFVGFFNCLSVFHAVNKSASNCSCFNYKFLLLVRITSSQCKESLFYFKVLEYLHVDSLLSTKATFYSLLDSGLIFLQTIMYHFFIFPKALVKWQESFISVQSSQFSDAISHFTKDTELFYL